MTTDEIDNLEAGVEIDRMVAEACGVRLDHSGLVIPQLTDCKEVQFSPHRRSFRPSTCWDDAMEAAEGDGSCGMTTKLSNRSELWRVYDRISMANYVVSSGCKAYGRNLPCYFEGSRFFRKSRIELRSCWYSCNCIRAWSSPFLARSTSDFKSLA